MTEDKMRKALEESLVSIINTSEQIKEILESIKKEYDAGDPMNGFSKKSVQDIMMFRLIVDKYSMEYIEKALERSNQLMLNVDNALKRIGIKEARDGNTTKPIG